MTRTKSVPHGGKRLPKKSGPPKGLPQRGGRAGTGKPLNESTIALCARVHCTMAETAAAVGLSEPAFLERLTPELRALIDRERENGRMSLRRRQFVLAMNGDRTMLVWLGKNVLGQSDRMDHRVEAKGLEQVLREIAEAERGG